MNKRTAGLVAAAALLLSSSALLAQTVQDFQPPSDALRNRLLLLVWGPLGAAILSEFFIKTAVLERCMAQPRRAAALFSVCATLCEFLATSVLMALLYRPSLALRQAFSSELGQLPAAAAAGLFSTLVVFIVIWRLYYMALPKFLDLRAPDAQEPQTGPVPRWNLKRASALIAALHPLLLHVYTAALYMFLASKT